MQNIYWGGFLGIIFAIFLASVFHGRLQPVAARKTHRRRRDMSA
jgi:hypothetical protein